jgi:hypothetical protein
MTLGFPFSQNQFHAAPELAYVEKLVHSDMLAQKANETDPGKMALLKVE